MTRYQAAKWMSGCVFVGVVLAVPPLAASAQQQQQQQQRPASAGSQQTEPLPSMQEIRQARDDGHYRRASQQAARALRLTGNEALPYDPYDLQVIRGDSLLQLGDPATALQAYEAAAESREPKQVGTARATALLIRRSTDRKYTPTSKPNAEPIDIVDRDSRRKAAAALLEDELARREKDLAAAERATTLVPILDVVQPVLDLRALEHLATDGKGERTRDIATAINERARELIAREVAQLGGRVAQMEQMASRIQNDGGGSVYRRGLISTERQDLRDMITYLNRIGRAAQDARQIARMQGAKPDAWDPIITEALHVRDYAQNVLAME